MKMLEALRNRRARESRRETRAASSSPDEQTVPIPGYDQLDEKQIRDQLSQLSQLELATIETYERAHGSRPAVLEKLREGYADRQRTAPLHRSSASPALVLLRGELTSSHFP